MTRFSAAFAGALAMAGLVAVPGFAQQTATTTFNVTATVQAACTVTATDLAFGTYTALVSSVGTSGAAVDQTSAVSVTCSSGAPYTVALNDGQNASSGQRRMASGTNFLAYELYSDTGRTTRWGNAGLALVSGTGNGSAQALTVYGRIAASQAVPPGSYSDVITVTLTY